MKSRGTGLIVALLVVGVSPHAQAQGAMWVPGPWSTCSVPCGGGTQTRSYQCVDTDRGTVLPDSSCADNPKPPDEMQACNTAACTYSWQTGVFSMCSEPCGDGIQTRPVNCVLDATGETVTDTFCDAASRPTDTQMCNLGACTYSWQTGAYGMCSEPCGDGMQTRPVVCVVDATGQLVADTFCDAGSRPADTQMCNLGACTYSWQAGAFGMCSEPCGDGMQTRPVTCVADLSGATVADMFCDAGSRPADTQMCNLGACTYSWQTGAFDSCSETCGDGTQTRPVVCVVDETGQMVEDSFCDAGSRPSDSQSCNLGPCMYTWLVGEYGACSEPCGGGTSTRSVTCVDLDDATVDDSLCDSSVRPDDAQSCNEDPCLDGGVDDGGVDDLDGGVAGDGGSDVDAGSGDGSGGCATAPFQPTGAFLLLLGLWWRRRVRA